MTRNGRYQCWQSALDAAASQPRKGIGPGTFEFWWAAHGSFYTNLRNAHSLHTDFEDRGRHFRALVASSARGGAGR
ncbi:MAG: hypothetical protein LC713_02050 [Actinobacteria bacterium]|nr:hypothetical protein [Actinomycetota bacterium]